MHLSILAVMTICVNIMILFISVLIKVYVFKLSFEEQKVKSVETIDSE